MNRAIAHLHFRPVGMRLPRRKVFSLGRQAGNALCHDSFQTLHGFLVWTSANVAGAVIVIVGEHPADFSVVQDARSPVILVSLALAVALATGERLLLAAQANKFPNIFLVERPATLLNLLQFSLQVANLLLQIFEGWIGRFAGQGLA